MRNLIKKIQNYSNRFDLFDEKMKLVVGVSGGPDSVCLLDILYRLRKKYKFEIIVAHVNYGLRGKDSDKDAEFVGELSEKYDFRLQILNVLKSGIGKTSENELRKIRYEFFEKIRKESGFDRIVVAHNHNDQAETFLMRILRGSGLYGLRSMRPRNGKIIRPLLNTSRKEILEYLKRNELSYRTDKSNEDLKFFRNKIRHRLIPFLEKEYNPTIVDTLAGMTKSVADDYDFINNQAERLWKKVVLSEEIGEKITLDVSVLNKQHPAIQRQIVRRAILKVKGDLFDIQSAHIEEVLKILKSEKNKNQIKTFVGLKMKRKGAKLLIL